MGSILPSVSVIVMGMKYGKAEENQLVLRKHCVRTEVLWGFPWKADYSGEALLVIAVVRCEG